jgi:hypothetical protein
VGCLLSALLCCAWCGCAAVEVGVSNPVPGLSRVAVVPFFNLSTEPAVDGRRFAEAYFTELQMTPGFEVLPVGVAEVAVREHGLNMNSPADALKLARILGVDAVVLGAVTAYDPYYPPRLGLRVAWYSPYDWRFAPGIPTDPHARPPVLAIPLPAMPCLDECFQGGPGTNKRWGKVGELPAHQRDGGPNDRCPDPGGRDWNSDGTGDADAAHGGTGEGGTAEGETFDGVIFEGDIVCEPAAVRGQSPEVVVTDMPPLVTEFAPPGFGAVRPFDPHRPLMSYSRMFDGADADLTAALRDHVELGDDLRSGGWQGHLYRSDDFLRFTARLMIDEMLMLHGGETRHRLVLMHRSHD